MASSEAHFSKSKAPIDAESVILVTGGSGLLGCAVRAVVEKQSLPGRWIFLSSRECDLRDTTAVRALFTSLKPTHVIHLAAFVGGLFVNMREKVRFWFDNVNMNNNVLQCCHEFGVRKVISCSSTCVLPDAPDRVLDESSIMTAPPAKSNDAYAYSKRMMQAVGEWYLENGSSTTFVTVIPCNLYGPHDNFNLQDSHVVPGLIHKCYLAKEKGEDLTVYGSGRPLRQFLFSNDCADLILWIMNNYDEKDPVILAVSEDEEVTIRHAAETIAKAMAFEGQLIFDSSKSDGQLKKTASNSKLMALRPDWKFSSFEEGIRQTTQWFKQNYESARK